MSMHDWEAQSKEGPKYNNAWMMITRRCDQSCAFCYTGSDCTSLHKELNQICSDLALARQRCHGDTIGLSGGEPTMHPELFKIIDEACKWGFSRVCMFTNGVRFRDRAFLAELVDRGLFGVMIPLHGAYADLHNELVGRQHFDLVIEGIQAALEAGVATIINTVVTTSNIDNIGSIYELVENSFPGAYNYRITYPSIMGNVLNRLDLVPDYERVASVVASVLDASNSVAVATELIPLCLLSPDFDIATEHTHSGERDFVFGSVSDQYDSVRGKPCLECRFKECCYGLQREAVILHGVPHAYGGHSFKQRTSENVPFNKSYPR